MPSCHVCGQDNPELARFCLACGAALTADPPREERKIVTVLFADLVGFTSRAEQLDPEDVRAVLAPYWERLRSELEKRGGTVEKFIGDAVMALFGAPVAHDDDPLRAVGAALAIRDWARDESDVQVRIAVNTGEALVLLGARPGEGEGMAAGDVVNTAARLQSAAPVNGVLVGETTYRATRDVIEYVERDPVSAKGKAKPVPVWEAVQLRSRLGVDVERGMSLPLVGRVRELSVIVDAFERARSEREPQLVTLVGVPGIGKSRLVGEFFSRLEGQPDLVWWRQGRALPYGEGVSFWALAEMVKAQAGIAENDTGAVAEEKLRASVHALVDDEDRAWVAEHLLPLVGVERHGGGGGGGESLPAWRRYFEGLAEQRPLVLVFEDMHWADEGLLDFIDHLVDWASGVPLLVLATARPELLERRPAWGGGKLNVSTVALTPLSDDESAQIIHGVLEQAVLPAEIQTTLLDRAGGNPLYAEQFARLYMERGSAEDLPLPETVQGLIAARIDGLPPDEKRLLQEAAVHGKVFWAGALAGDDVEQSLHSLERKGMLRRERRSAVAGETQYAFRHVLVRDVAYGQIPRAARSEKHLRAADWIESLGRADDQAELVVHHLLTAEELAGGGGGPSERTRLALRRAGERAVALGAFPAAERYFVQALVSWPEDDPDRPHLQAAHARARFRSAGDDAPLGSAIEALERAGHVEAAGDLSAFTANALWYLGKAAEADAAVARARALLAGQPPSPALAAVLAESARLATFQGRYDDAAAESAEAIELATRFGLEELQAGLLATSGVLALVDGELAESCRLFEAAVELAPPGSPALFRALANLGTVAITEGDAAAWAPRHAAAVEAATRSGDKPNLLWLEAAGIDDAFRTGRWDETLRRADAFLASGRHYVERSVMLVKAQILASRGFTDDALALRDGALERLAGTTDIQASIPTLFSAAWVSLIVDDEARAAELVRQVLPIVQATRHRAPGVGASEIVTAMRVGDADDWIAHHARHAETRRVLAALALLAGRWTEAADLWARVSPYDEAIARLHGARELVAAGRRAEADVQLQRGLAFFRAVGATRVVRGAEALLAAAS